MFKDGMMSLSMINDAGDKYQSVDVGTFKTTGTGTDGGTIFELSDIKADPKVWPATFTHGIYK